MPQFFKENGYWTASVGKVFHNADNEHGDIAWNEHVRFVNDELPIVTAARKKFENERGSVEKPANRKAWRELRKDVLVGIDSQTPPGYSLRDQKWRYGKWPDGEELYDLNKDPNEKRNLAGNPEYEGRLKDFRQTLSAKQQMAASQRH